MLRKAQFAAVGLTGVAVSFASLWLLIDVLHWNHSIAYAVQTVLAIEVNFLLNDAITWRDRRGTVSFSRRAARFHATRIGLMIPVNQVMFFFLQPPLGTIWANLICIGATTVANWFLNDRVVFKPVKAEPDTIVIPGQRPPAAPEIGDVDLSVVVPVRNSGATIRACVVSLLQQSIHNLEVIVVGDRDDNSWNVLRDISDKRLRRVGLNIDRDGAIRDANLKRHFGMQMARGRSIALTDSDMTLASNWAWQGLRELETNDVAGGGMKSETLGFVARYVDTNLLASRTPRSHADYLLTRSTYGKRGMKPPITASLFLNRRVYRDVGGPDPSFTRSFEDYEWARRIVDSRYRILMTHRLDGEHLHRTEFGPMMRDYHRAGKGCGDYIRAFPHCRFARNRRRQVLLLAGAGIGGVAAAVIVPLYTIIVAGAVVAAVCGISAWRTRTLDSVLYPFLTLALGLNYWRGLVTALLPIGRSLAKPAITAWAAIESTLPRGIDMSAVSTVRLPDPDEVLV